MTCKAVYLDNAASSFPKPHSVTAAMTHLMKTNTSNPGRSGHALSDENAALIYNARKVVSAFFGIGDRPENIVFTANATHAINIALNGLLEDGDSVIISDLEHNSVLRPVIELARKGTVTAKIAEVAESDGETFANFEKLLDNRTKMIFVTHASNVNGKVLPTELLAKFCAEHGLLFCLDASQTAGHIPCDTPLFGADILCAAGHKSLLGPQGTGILAMKGTVFPKPLICGGTGSSSLIPYQPDDYPEALESGTPNTVGIAGLAEGIRFLNRKGEALRCKVDKLYNEIFDGLSEIDGVTILGQRNNPVPLLSFNLGSLPSEEVTRRLASKGICVRGGFHCSPLFHRKYGTVARGAVRVSPGFFNTERQIRRFLKECRALGKELQSNRQ